MPTPESPFAIFVNWVISLGGMMPGNPAMNAVAVVVYETSSFVAKASALSVT